MTEALTTSQNEHLVLFGALLSGVKVSVRTRDEEQAHLSFTLRMSW